MTKLCNEDQFSCDRLLTVTDVAELTGLAVGSVYHLISQRRIPVIRLSKRCVRFRHSDLQAWLDSMTDLPPPRGR